MQELSNSSNVCVFCLVSLPSSSSIFIYNCVRFLSCIPPLTYNIYTKAPESNPPPMFGYLAAKEETFWKKQIQHVNPIFGRRLLGPYQTFQHLAGTSQRKKTGIFKHFKHFFEKNSKFPWQQQINQITSGLINAYACYALTSCLAG